MALVQVWDVPHLQRPHGAPRYGSHSSAQPAAAAPAPSATTSAQPPVIKMGTRGMPRQQQPQVTLSNTGVFVTCAVVNDQRRPARAI